MWYYNNMEKIYSKCDILKDFSCFGQRKQSKDRYINQRKECRNSKNRERYLESPENTLRKNKSKSNKILGDK